MTAAGPARPYSVEPRLVRQLVARHWGSSGWRTPRGVPPQELVDAGLQFVDQPTRSHDEWVDVARAVVSATSRRAVVAAFVASLGSGRLDVRSALGSFAVLQHLQPHPLVPEAGGWCRVCGLHEEVPSDPNVLSFERIKWAGVRREDVVYCTVDLELFAAAPDPLASFDEGGTALRVMLDDLRARPDDARPGHVARTLPAVVRGAAAGREAVVEVLGVTGVLRTPDHPSFRSCFVPADERQDRPGRSELAYPARWWRGSSGLDEEAVGDWFADVLGDG